MALQRRANIKSWPYLYCTPINGFQSTVELDKNASGNVTEKFQAVKEVSAVDDGRTLKAYGNWGTPLFVEWDNKVRELVDGLGLCYCNRWRPDARGRTLGTKAKILSAQLHALMFEFVVGQLGDLRVAGMKLALGKFTESPFKREALEDVRKKWAQLLEVPSSALCRAEGQPFMLDMTAQTL